MRRKKLLLELQTDKTIYLKVESPTMAATDYITRNGCAHLPWDVAQWIKTIFTELEPCQYWNAIDLETFWQLQGHKPYTYCRPYHIEIESQETTQNRNRMVALARQRNH